MEETGQSQRPNVDFQKLKTWDSPDSRHTVGMIPYLWRKVVMSLKQFSSAMFSWTFYGDFKLHVISPEKKRWWWWAGGRKTHKGARAPTGAGLRRLRRHVSGVFHIMLYLECPLYPNILKGHVRSSHRPKTAGGKVLVLAFSISSPKKSLEKKKQKKTK